MGLTRFHDQILNVLYNSPVGRTVFDMDSDADSMSTGTSEGSTPVLDRRRKASAGSDESGESGSSSNIFKVRLTN